MTMHKKHKHPEPTKVVGAGSAMAMFVAKARLEAEITATWLVRDIVSSAFAAIGFETPAKHRSFKFDQVDGRKKNGGRSKL